LSIFLTCSRIVQFVTYEGIIKMILFAYERPMNKEKLLLHLYEKINNNQNRPHSVNNECIKESIQFFLKKLVE
jgi:hypothetical protein